MTRLIWCVLFCAAPSVAVEEACADDADDAALLQRGARSKPAMMIAEDADNDAFALLSGGVLPKLQNDTGTRGWAIERMFHSGAVGCPWQPQGEKPDKACLKRFEEIQEMRDKISQCQHPLKFNEETFGHRGAALVAPEESLISYQIGAESGAGYLECDVSPTKDLELVCRHSNCDLATTTDLVTNHPDLNAKCMVPFVPGSGKPATCCTFDFTLAELGRLCCIMDSTVNASARSSKEYITGFPGFRSNAAGNKCQPVLTYEEWLKMLRKGGFNAIPELKDTWYNRTNEFLASKGKSVFWLAHKFATLLRSYGFKPWPKAGRKLDKGKSNSSEGTGKAGIVYGVMQTFDYRIAEYWKQIYPEMIVQYMWQVSPPDGANCSDGTGNGDYGGPEGPGGDCGGEALLTHLHEIGVNMFAPPIYELLKSGKDRTVVPSKTAKFLKKLGVEAIGSWSLERQGTWPKPYGPYRQANTPENPTAQISPSWNAKDWYYHTTNGNSTWQYVDVLRVLDALFKKVGIRGLFSDYPATVSAYVNCVLHA